MDPSGTAQDGGQFAGRVPEVYERLLVPMIFQAPAERLATSVAGRSPVDILETAAGTGALTRELRQRCPASRIIATDLNQPMLDIAAARLRSGSGLTWQQVDALQLPFDDASFDVVVCQFGVMFFPDRVRAHQEARRVLRPDGGLLFTVWDRIENNPIPRVIEAALNHEVLNRERPEQTTPPRAFAFMSRAPHGYHSADRIRHDLDEAGLTVQHIVPADGVCRTTAADAAVAFCQGTPLRAEIETHPVLDLAEATSIAERALLEHFGPGPVESPIRWFEVSAVCSS